MLQTTYHPQLWEDIWKKIDSDLIKNKLEHDKLREFQIELEDTLRESSYAAEYKYGLMEGQIKKI